MCPQNSGSDDDDDIMMRAKNGERESDERGELNIVAESPKTCGRNFPEQIGWI
jgi:hypothetical protein